MYKINEVAKHILESDYLLKNETMEQMFKRTCYKIASSEDTEYLKNYWFDRFYNSISDGLWIPATPFLMNSNVNNMFSSCFVIGGLNDDLDSIFDTNKRTAIVTKMGGGIGINISKLREKGTKISSTGGESTGAISFMKVFNTTLEVVMQARRRGAGIIVMDIYHPDIESFITVKSDHKEITNFNISVLVDDNFMKAVKENSEIELKSPLGHIVKKINAKDLFMKIVTNARYHAEPGILFKSTINRDNPCLNNMGEIDSVNACVTGDTLVLTNKGYFRIDSLINQNTKVWNGVEFSETIPSVTNTNQKIKIIEFSDGSTLKCTDYHKFYIQNNYRHSAEIVMAKDLKLNDKIEKFRFPVIDGTEHADNKKMYTLGMFSGDRYLNIEKKWNCIGLYGKKRKLIEYLEVEHSRNEDKQDRTFVRLPHSYDSYSKDWIPNITYSISNRLNWLAGIIDSDGTLNSKDGSIGISSINKDFLNNIKLMLNTLGCNATLSLNKEEEIKEMPFDKTKNKEYLCQTSYRLLINASNVHKLIITGLNTHRVLLIANPNRDASKFIYITNISEQHNIEKYVYCFNEPIKNKGMFNGILTGNCGEIPLYDDEACNLSALNLQLFVDNNGDLNEELLITTVENIVRFLDNSIDINVLPDEIIKKAVLKTRKLGIGVMGLNGMLVKKGLKYDSKEGRKFAKSVMKIINDTAHEYSCKLIKEGRELPEAWYGSTFEDKGIKIRNLSLTSGQPTGATQIIMDEICSSAGIECFFAIVYKRNLRGQEYILTNSLFKEIGINEGWFNDKVKYAILNNNGSCQGIKEVPKKWQELFKTASEVHWKDHIKMQAELQKVTTNALSKTINMPQSTTVEDVYDSYMMAFDLGCKGTTVYIQNSRDNQVLTSEKNKIIKEYVPINPIIEVADAKRLKIKTGCGSIWLMLIYDYENNLCEIFSESGSKGGCNGMTKALSRMISIGLRANIDPRILVEQLQSVGCDVSKDRRKKDKEIGISCADGIGIQILKFINGDFNNTNSIEYVQEIDISQNEDIKKIDSGLYKCDECGNFTLTKYDGCIECTNCGWRRCR